jgi:hypothetical protein
MIRTPKVGDFVKAQNFTGRIVKVEKTQIEVHRDDNKGGGGVVLPNGISAWICSLYDGVYIDDDATTPPNTPIQIFTSWRERYGK